LQKVTIDTLSEVQTKPNETGFKGVMSILRFLRRTPKLPWVLALLALLFSVPSAHASTFNFSFTTTALLGALKSSDTDFTEDGYYTILLQPTTSDGLSADSLGASGTPDSGDGTSDWQSTTDSADPFGTGTWIEFAKGNTQTTVTLVSGTNGGTGSMFVGQTYSDNGAPAPPITFGTTVGTIHGIMAASDVFSFQLSGSTTPAATGVTFTGEAYAIWSSGSSTTYNTPKTREDIPFTLTFSEIGSTWVATPEPDTWILFLTGAAFVLAAGILKNKKRAASNGS
jgi:hypothetical protein